MTKRNIMAPVTAMTTFLPFVDCQKVTGRDLARENSSGAHQLFPNLVAVTHQDVTPYLVYAWIFQGTVFAVTARKCAGCVHGLN